MIDSQKSILPYDSNYVLVHKKSVALIAVYSGILISYISRKTNFGDKNAISKFMDLAKEEIRQKSDQEINLIVDRIAIGAFKAFTRK